MTFKNYLKEIASAPLSNINIGNFDYEQEFFTKEERDLLLKKGWSAEYPEYSNQNNPNMKQITVSEEDKKNGLKFASPNVKKYGESILITKYKNNKNNNIIFIKTNSANKKEVRTNKLEELL